MRWGSSSCVDDADVATAAEAMLELETAQGCQSVRFGPEVAGWPEFVPQLKDCPNLAEPLFAVLDQSKAISSLPGYAEDVAWLRREGVAALSGALPRSVHNGLTTVAAIDRVVSFAGGGMLVVGWHHEPQSRLNSAQILCADGSAIDVLDRMFPMPRRDVYEALVQQFPSVGENCGFILFMPGVSRESECRALRLELSDGSIEWLQLQATESINTGHQLLRALSASLGDISKLDSTIFEFFESGFGATIERLSTPPRPDANARVERQFGQSPAEPDVSVIVPLYGRCDFLRYQLAHFADDPDFARVDLIYVIDDPRIVAETLTLASHYESPVSRPVPGRSLRPEPRLRRRKQRWRPARQGAAAVAVEFRRASDRAWLDHNIGGCSCAPAIGRRRRSAPALRGWLSAARRNAGHGGPGSARLPVEFASRQRRALAWRHRTVGADAADRCLLDAEDCRLPRARRPRRGLLDRRLRGFRFLSEARA